MKPIVFSYNSFEAHNSNPDHTLITPTNTLDGRITIPHQRTLQSLSLVTSVLLRKHDQSNQYQHSNSNNGTHNHKRHSSSPFPPILTHRPQSQNIILPNTLLLLGVTVRRFRFLSHYTSTHPITSTHCESDVRHLTNFWFHVLEWIVHSLASMFPTLHNIPSSLHYVTVLANKRLVTLLSILSSRRNVPNLEPNRLACPHTTEFGFLTNTVAKHMTMPSKANPHSTGSNTTT